MKAIKLLSVVCGLAFLLIACTAREPAVEPDIEGATWVLADLNGREPLEGRQPTLEFEAGKISGNTGCNHYGGSYQIEGDAIRFEGLFNTEMACQDPAGIMEQEQVYLELLRTAKSLELVDGELTIFTGLQPILRFRRE